MHVCREFKTQYPAHKHQQNLKKLREELTTLLQESLEKQSEYHLWCEARLGKVDWRVNRTDLQRSLCIRDILRLRSREFYTR